MLRRSSVNFFDGGIDSLLQEIYLGAEINSTILYEAAKHQFNLLIKILLALGLSKEEAISKALSKNEIAIADYLQLFTIEECILTRLLYWAIKNFQPDKGLELLERLLKVKATMFGDTNNNIEPLTELAVFFNFPSVVRVLRAYHSSSRCQSSIRTAGYWAAKNNDEKMFQLFCNDAKTATLTLQQLKKDKLDDIFSKHLNSDHIKYLGITPEKLQLPLIVLPEIKSANVVIQNIYELASSADEKELATSQVSTENLFETIKLAVQNTNFVALTLLFNVFHSQANQLIVHALKEERFFKPSPLMDFLIIGNKINPMDVCILLRDHSYLDLRNKFIKTYWHLHGVLRFLIKRNIDLKQPMDSQEQVLFNHLEKRDKIVKTILRSCLKELSITASSRDLLAYYRRFDIEGLLLHSPEKKAEKIAPKIITLPDIIWKKIIKENIYGEKAVLNSVINEDDENELNEQKVESKLIPSHVPYKNEDDPKTWNRYFYTLLKPKPDLLKAHAEYKQLIIFKDQLHQEFNTISYCNKHDCLPKIKRILGISLFLLSVNIANIVCMFKLFNNYQMARAELDFIKIPHTNLTCYDEYVYDKSCTLRKSLNHSCETACERYNFWDYISIFPALTLMLNYGCLAPPICHLISHVNNIIKKGKNRLDGIMIDTSPTIREEIQQLGRFKPLVEGKRLGDVKLTLNQAISKKEVFIKNSSLICTFFPTKPLKELNESKRGEIKIEVKGSINANPKISDIRTPLLKDREEIEPSRCPCVIL